MQKTEIDNSVVTNKVLVGIERAYMMFAVETAKLSKATRLKVACVIVRGNNLIAYGYNGQPYGFDNMCENEDGTTKITVVHAEENALIKCARDGHSTYMASAYMTHLCCPHCAALFVQAGIKKVVYLDEYRNHEAVEIFKLAGIEIIKATLN